MLFRSPDIGRFLSQDPIRLLGGTNLYQYAPNPTGWVDPLGLEKKAEKKTHSTYVLRNKEGKIVYVGITERAVSTRIGEHRNGNASAGIKKKEFATYEVVGEYSTRRESRNLESALLNREVENKKMLNKRRKDNVFYHSYKKGATLTDGRKIIPSDEVDKLLEKSSKNQMDPKTHKEIDCKI